MIIKKKTWPEWFQKILDGKKTAELRLADFDVKEGDILLLEEYDPKTRQYTGRTIKKTVKNLNRVKLSVFHNIEDISMYGHWVIEFD